MEITGIPVHALAGGKLTGLSIGPLLGEAIARNHQGKSISALFVWAMSMGLADANPVIGTVARLGRTVYVSRNRTRTLREWARDPLGLL